MLCYIMFKERNDMTALRRNTKTVALHIRTTTEIKEEVSRLAQLNGVTETIIIEWAIARLLRVAEAQNGKLVCLDGAVTANDSAKA